MIDAVAESPLFLNRELSWLEFNARVLHEAFDDRNPLLERVKFLAIFSTNLDEFYMVRVAGLRRQVAAGVAAGQADGLTPQEQLDAIDRRVTALRAQARRCLNERLLPALAEQGVRLVSMSDLQPSEWLAVDDFFESQVFPVLTPLAVDPGHPFPYVSNLSLSLAVEVRDPERGTEHFARVKVPKSLPRWVPFGRAHHFVPLEQVIGANLGALFPGMEVVGWWAFRVTRNSDLDITHQDVEDLLEMIEEQVFKRRFGEVVRLEVQDGMPTATCQLLLDEIREQEEEPSLPLTMRDVQDGGALLELGDLHAIAALDLAELKDPPFAPLVPERLRDPARSIFDVIREGDLLVHHPFESFPATVERFLSEAARDDAVLAIKMTLYRTSGDTAIVRALTEAAQRGKQVAVLVELQARFDETNNITWARTLEGYGVHVAYGIGGLKTHTKTTLVVRRDPDGLRRYVHVGTGNYNSKTARLYTDVGLFSCTPSLGADLSDLFNLITGFSRQRYYRKLLVAPANMRSRFLELIAREAELARAGQGGRIVAKMNALVDPEIIDALYRASQAGVAIDLVVRGICCLRPGVPGVSETIRVTSIVGRFLEHSRIWYFANGGADEYYVGSADWMPRNLDRRVEAVAPVEDPVLHVRLRALLDTCLADNRQAWELGADGTYTQRDPGGGAVRSTHVTLLRDPWGIVASRETPRSVPRVQG
ncbi:MAG: Polyphosphate kinase [uncultured Gemmatimonadaceae bacterium]|uniref:Polyphosphate kinase n=1 Tax=uncultured Gemmatimonadaceae bacterium TaxID=246130 RepID=A0A6J4KGD6_9BACT|nr:MAG: Polyphosphate kinase [uncultured Gemmatimonadaceae bacterium]